MRLNSNWPFKTDSTTVVCVRIIEFGGQVIEFCGAGEVLVNPLVIFETTRTAI
jgi:hypothetical protein